MHARSNNRCIAVALRRNKQVKATCTRHITDQKLLVMLGRRQLEDLEDLITSRGAPTAATKPLDHAALDCSTGGTCNPRRPQLAGAHSSRSAAASAAAAPAGEPALGNPSAKVATVASSWSEASSMSPSDSLESKSPASSRNLRCSSLESFGTAFLPIAVRTGEAETATARRPRARTPRFVETAAAFKAASFGGVLADPGGESGSGVPSAKPPLGE